MIARVATTRSAGPFIAPPVFHVVGTGRFAVGLLLSQAIGDLRDMVVTGMTEHLKTTPSKRFVVCVD